MTVTRIDPDEIEDSHDAAEFVASCNVTRLDTEMGRLRIFLEDDGGGRYVLDLALRRISRTGDQAHLVDKTNDTTLYRD